MYGGQFLSQKKYAQLAVLSVVASVLFFSPDQRNSQAAFELNFDPTTTSGHSYDGAGGGFGGGDQYYSCGMAFQADANCGFGDTDEAWSHTDIAGGASFQDTFTTGGKTYWHVIIGDSTTDTFYLEYMIEANSSWGTYDGRSDMPASASAYSAGSIGNCGTTSCEMNMGKMYNADSAHTGTGSGNPNRVVMRMVLDDGITYSEFLKGAGDGAGGVGGDSSAYFDKKPLIIQKITEPGVMNNEYSLDMRSKTYSDSTPVTNAQKTNKTFILEGTTAANQGDYDSTGGVQTPTLMTDTSSGSQVVINGGAFTYTVGTEEGGSFDTTDVSNGKGYTYYESDGVTLGSLQTQPIDRDYSVFCDTDQNSNWSGNGACVDESGGGGGRGGGGWGGW